MCVARTIDELRADPSKQKSRERKGSHLPLDHEREVRRQGGRQDDAVEIARMIRDDDAGADRHISRVGDSNGAADNPKEELRKPAGQTPAHASARGNRHEQQCRRATDEECKPRVRSVAQARQRAPGCGTGHGYVKQ